MSIIEFAAIGNPVELIEGVAGISDDSRYSWLKPIVETTLAEDIRTTLLASPPNKEFYSPGNAIELLADAERRHQLIEQKRSELYAIEAQSIQLAMDYSLSEQLFESDFKLARLKLLESLAATPAAPNLPTEKELEDRFKLVRAAINSRILAHGLPGSSLNFGERAISLREEICRQTRSLMEFVHAIYEGAAAFGVLLEKPPITDANDIISDLGRWLFESKQAIDFGSWRDVGFERWIPLVQYFGLFGNAAGSRPANPLFQLADPPPNPLNFSPLVIDFALTEYDIRPPVRAPNSHYRLVGLALGLHFYDQQTRIFLTPEDGFAKKSALVHETTRYLDSVRADAVISPPKRLVASGSLQTPRFSMTAHSSSSERCKEFYSGGHVQNLSPLGNWSINLDFIMFSHERGNENFRMLSKEELLKLRDVFVGLRIIQRVK